MARTILITTEKGKQQYPIPANEMVLGAHAIGYNVRVRYIKGYIELDRPAEEDDVEIEVRVHGGDDGTER